MDHSRLPWATGIAIVEAAVAMALEPQDGIDQED